WFIEQSEDKIGRITPSGVITEFPLPTSGSSPAEITSGPGHNLWFTESGTSKIGQITSGK
ncbi:MAG TPA: Virginiamycin B lyase, partial [Ktedonobacteraceae bacterium]|nr:Virginiamycin B lyase [Ktedonobacteraceae bacterium]